MRTWMSRREPRLIREGVTALPKARTSASPKFVFQTRIFSEDAKSGVVNDSCGSLSSEYGGCHSPGHHIFRKVSSCLHLYVSYSSQYYKLVSLFTARRITNWPEMLLIVYGSGKIDVAKEWRGLTARLFSLPRFNKKKMILATPARDIHLGNGS